MKKIIAPIALLLMIGSPLWAGSSSVEFDISGGKGTSGASVTGDLGLPPTSDNADTHVTLSYSGLHTTAGTEGRTRQYSLGLTHRADESLEGHGTLTYWRDQLNDVAYAGPTLGAIYTWNEAGTGSTANPDEIASVTVNSDLFVYGTEISASSTTRTVYDPVKQRYVKRIIPGGTADEHVTQFHPNLIFEVPLFDRLLVPSWTAGYSFYSKDPAALETLVGRPVFSNSAGHVNSLVAGFVNTNLDFSLQVALPWKFDCTAHLGADRLQTDYTWATTQGVTLDRTFFDRVTAKMEWSRSIQSGASSDLFTGGLTYAF